MAKKWYPVVDYAACIDCGTCSSFCQHGVYDVAKVPTPVVANPDGCVNRCHGCGNLCPVGAITYVGDDTGWTPPMSTKTSTESGCSCCGQEPQQPAGSADATSANKAGCSCGGNCC